MLVFTGQSGVASLPVYGSITTVTVATGSTEGVTEVINGPVWSGELNRGRLLLVGASGGALAIGSAFSSGVFT